MMKRDVYLDYAATTPLAPRVFKAMRPYYEDKFGNPSNLYARGREAKQALARAAEKIARILSCRADEIIFTGSGTESDNLAVLGVARAHKNFGNHIITSAIEHHAVLHAAGQLEKEGFRTTAVGVDAKGMVRLDALRSALDDEATLVSVMYANNEVGTVQPIREIGKIVEQARVRRGERGVKTPLFFHTDACQAAGYLDLNVKRLGVDLLTFNGSKIYGPKGVGALFARRGVKITPLVFGGGQEKGLRSGTENVAGIVGLAEALDIAQREKGKECRREKKLRDYLLRGLVKKIPKVILNGHPTRRLPNNVNVSILDVEGEALLLYCDERGISVSTGSACNSESLEPSHVLAALGLPYEYIHGSVRFTLGRGTTRSDIHSVLKVVPQAVARLRKISPLNLKPGVKEKMSQPRAFVGGQTPHFLRRKHG